MRENRIGEPVQAMSAIAVILEAARFAAQKHRDQRRKGPEATPYINHPLDVAHTLASVADVEDPLVLCAAILHDTIEDTTATEAELRQRFGDAVTDIVMECTDDKSLPKEVRKRLQVEHAGQKSPEAALVKISDKIHNLQDLLTSPPQSWPIERIREYFEWSRAVVDGLRGVNAPLEAVFDSLYARKP